MSTSQSPQDLLKELQSRLDALEQERDRLQLQRDQLSTALDQRRVIFEKIWHLAQDALRDDLGIPHPPPGQRKGPLRLLGFFALPVGWAWEHRHALAPAGSVAVALAIVLPLLWPSGGLPPLRASQPPVVQGAPPLVTHYTRRRAPRPVPVGDTAPVTLTDRTHGVSPASTSAILSHPPTDAGTVPAPTATRTSQGPVPSSPPPAPSPTLTPTQTPTLPIPTPTMQKTCILKVNALGIKVKVCT